MVLRRPTIKLIDDSRTAALPSEINLIRGLIPQRLVSSLTIVKREIGLETGLDLGQGFIVLEINVFILDGAPQALDENIVRRASTAIPADPNRKGL